MTQYSNYNVATLCYTGQLSDAFFCCLFQKKQLLRCVNQVLLGVPQNVIVTAVMDR